MEWHNVIQKIAQVATAWVICLLFVLIIGFGNWLIGR